MIQSAPRVMTAALLLSLAVSARAGEGESHDRRCFKTVPTEYVSINSIAQVRTGALVRATPVVLSDGAIAVGSHDGILYVLDESGALLSTYKIGEPIESAAGELPQRVLVVGSARGKLYFIDSKGAINFRKLGDDQAVITAPAFISKRSKRPTVVVGATDGTVYFVDSKNRKVTGRFKAGAKVGAPRGLPDGTVLVASDDGHLYHLDHRGKLIAKALLGKRLVGTPAVLEDGTIVIGTEDSKVHFLGADLSPLRAVEVGLGSIQSSPIVLGDGTVVVQSIFGDLHHVNSAGDVRTVQRFGLGMYTSAPAVLEDGSLVAGSLSKGELNLFGPDGRHRTQFLLGFVDQMRGSRRTLRRDGISTSPVLTPKGNLVFGSESGAIHLVGVEYTESSPYRNVPVPCRARKEREEDLSDLIVGVMPGVSGVFGASTDKRCFKRVPIYDTEVKARRLFRDRKISFGKSAEPLVLDDGVVVAVSEGGSLYFVRPDGGTTWFAPSAKLTSPSKAPDGSVAVGASNGYVYLLESNGKVKATYPMGIGATAPPVFASRTGKMYVGAADGTVHMFDAKGKHLGVTTTTSTAYDVTGVALRKNGRFVAVTRSGEYLEYSASGKLMRKAHFSGDSTIRAKPVITRKGRVLVAVSNGVVYRFHKGEKASIWPEYGYSEVANPHEIAPVLLGDDTAVVGWRYGEFRFVDGNSGVERATFKTLGYVNASPVVMHDGTVVIVTSSGNVHLVNPDGTTRATHDLGVKVSASPGIGKNGELVIAAENGEIYKLNVKKKSTGRWKLVGERCTDKADVENESKPPKRVRPESEGSEPREKKAKRVD